LRAEGDVGDDFVEGHAGAEEVADGEAVVPGTPMSQATGQKK
jgi:hypothetical protein